MPRRRRCDQQRHRQRQRRERHRTPRSRQQGHQDRRRRFRIRRRRATPSRPPTRPSPSRRSTAISAEPALARHGLGRRATAPAPRPRADCAARSGRGRRALRAPRAGRAPRPGLFACTVPAPPSWPVLSAASRSTTSAPRTSPTTMRSGRIRSACLTRSRTVISPTPSTFAHARPASPDAGAAAPVRRRPPRRRCVRPATPHPAAADSSVVFPAPVPPETRNASRAAMISSSSAAASGAIAPAAVERREILGGRPQHPQRQTGPAGGDRRAAPRAAGR